MTDRRTARIVTLILAAILGSGSAANGVAMLAAPVRWYFAVPGVTTTGPFNQHFVRDIGLAFVLAGAMILWGLARPYWRIPAWSAAAMWLGGHALFHLLEVATGICGADALIRDFPAVTMPALVAVYLAIWACRGDRLANANNS